MRSHDAPSRGRLDPNDLNEVLLSDTEHPHDMVIDEIEDHEQIDANGSDRRKIGERHCHDRLYKKNDDTDEECDPSCRVSLVHSESGHTETDCKDQWHKVACEIISVVESGCKICRQIGDGEDECQNRQYVGCVELSLHN